MKKERFCFVDLVKVLAIFLVILFHLLYQITLNNSLRMIGFAGVSLFFIASGFTLAKNYPNYEKFSFKWFVKRYIKIATMYYLALILIVVLFFTQSYSGNLFLNLFSHFAFIESFFSNFSYGIISSAWFLAPLLAYYLLFPFLNKIIKKNWMFFVPILILSVLVKFFLHSYTSSNILFFLGEFCFGIAFAYRPKIDLVALSLITILVQPVMFLPFAIFFLFSFIKNKDLDYSAIRFISSQTLVLFLFHEALIYLILNRWHIYFIPKYLAIVLYLLLVLVVVYLAGKIQKSILRN